MSGTAYPSEKPTAAGQTTGAGRALVGAFACLILLVLAASTLAIWDGRGNAVHSYEDRQARLGIVLAEQTGRALQAVDLVVAATVEQLQASGIETVADLRRATASEDFHTELGEKLRNLPQLEALAVQDADGQAINTSRFWPSIGTDLSGSDIFRHFHIQPGKDPYLTKPEQGRLGGTWTVFLGRQITGRDGRMIGIVTAVIA